MVTPSKILLTTIGAEGHSKPTLDAALLAVRAELQIIVLVRSELGVESTKEMLAEFRRDLAKRGPDIEIFNFSNFPLPKR